MSEYRKYYFFPTYNIFAYFGRLVGNKLSGLSERLKTHCLKSLDLPLEILRHSTLEAFQHNCLQEGEDWERVWKEGRK